MRGRLLYIVYSLFFISLTSCIENDIPYPIVEAFVTAIEVEGQTDADGNEGGSATINKNERTIQLYVGDEVSLKNIRIKQLKFTDEATLVMVDTTVCANYARFPRRPFADCNDIDCDTRIDCSQPVVLRLNTYQQYDWTLNVSQIVRRELSLEGQVGDAVIDDVNHSVVIYVTPDCNLRSLHVNKFTLGGQHGTVTPDPAAAGTYDFSDKCTFSVRRAYETKDTEWTVFVYPRENNTQTTSELFAMSSRAIVKGTMRSGARIALEYRRQNETTWTSVSQDEMNVVGSKFSLTLMHLMPSTTYVYRMLTDGTAGDETTFTTAAAPQLTDGSFDNWHKTGRKWNPWAEGGISFWDTGNQGATTVGESNSVPTDETCNGRGQAALLESKYIVIKFAAGNIFTGEYLETDGTNGILDFGRPFTGFPTALRVNYKFVSSTINKSADDDYKYMIGRPDSCQIYIALADWDEPYRIRTRPSVRRVFNPRDPGVIAYAQITVGDDVPQWKQQDIVLDYYPEAIGRTPKYILIVASASKYGDYFTGGEGTKLWIDNFELLYE